MRSSRKYLSRVPSINHNSGTKSWAVRPKHTHARKTWSDNAEFYNGQPWRKCRKSYHSTTPYCEVAHYENRLTAGKDVDHIIPIRLGGAMYDPDNLMTMGQHYHRKKSAMEQHKPYPLVAYRVTPNGKVPVDKYEICKILTKK